MTPTEEGANWELFLWALNDIGGDVAVCDIEDVFLRCFEISPTRFAWRTRPDLPDYKKCAKALRDAEARKPRLLVKTGDAFGRQLTVEGQEWVKVNRLRLQRLFDRGRAVQEPKRRPSLRLLADAENGAVFAAWRADQVVPSERWRLAEFLRCLPDSPVSTWRHRLETLRSAAYAAGRVQLLAFLDEVRRAHPEVFVANGEPHEEK